MERTSLQQGDEGEAAGGSGRRRFAHPATHPPTCPLGTLFQSLQPSLGYLSNLRSRRARGKPTSPECPVLNAKVNKLLGVGFLVNRKEKFCFFMQSSLN